MQKIGLAVSGGRDSCYLMHCFKHLNPIVLSVDHGLRSQSASEAVWVCEQAQKIGLESDILTNIIEKPQSSIQNTARKWRYDLLSEAGQKHNLQAIYLGHHRDDQAETVLSRLAHKSGYAGLCGMFDAFYYNNILFKRPLLQLSRPEITDAMKDTPYIDDPSNENTDFERVQNRKLLTENPNLTDALLNISAKARHFYYPLLLKRNDFLAQNAYFSQYGYAQIDHHKFAQEPWDLQQEILKFAIKYATGNAYIKNIPALNGKNFTLSNAEICFNKRHISIYRENRNVPQFDIKRFQTTDKSIGKDENIPFKAKQTLPPQDMSFRYHPQSLNYFVSIFDRSVEI